MYDTPQASRTTVRAAESRIEFALAGTFSILIAGTLWYVHSLFAEIAPSGRLWLWTWMVIVVTVVMAAVPLVVHLRRASDAEIMRIWSPAGKAIAIAFDLAVASSVWLLLPYASEPLRLLMVVFYAAVISGQVISTAESTGTIVFGVVSIFGSAAAFFLMTPGLYSVGLALFLLGFGALMIGVAAVLKVAIRSAIAARLRAEAISASLAEALAQATEARNSKTRFIAAATHDLRQPLQAAALFFNRAVGPDRAVQEEAVASARLAFEEAASLLDRLLDHLRLDGGLIQPAMKEVPLGPLLEQVCSEVAPLAAANGIALRLVPTRRQVHGDPHLIRRILRNLLHNAIRHSRGQRILIGTRARAGRVAVLVLDDGRGIANDMAGTLFAEEKPLQANARGGVGLGLPSSRKLAELMGGAVVHLPGWRRGSAFSLELSARAS
jgi:signal transduction histidine kinase